jgi:hypothetical protein
MTYKILNLNKKSLDRICMIRIYLTKSIISMALFLFKKLVKIIIKIKVLVIQNLRAYKTLTNKLLTKIIS